jgi:CHAD domain-containing protein
VFPHDAVDRFSSEFSWLGRLTGKARDVDVLVLSLKEHGLASRDPGTEQLLGRLEEIQQHEHQSLVAALDDDRYRRLLPEWAAFLNEPTPLECALRNAGRPLADVIAQRAWRLCRRIARAADEVDGDTPPERLHELRIDAKKLRYLIDIAPAFRPGDDLDSVVRALKDVQRTLGAFNDSHVQEQRLLEYGRALRVRGGSEPAVLAIERVAGERAGHRARLRAHVATALTRFRSRRTRAACRAAFRQRDRKKESS